VETGIWVRDQHEKSGPLDVAFRPLSEEFGWYKILPGAYLGFTVYVVNTFDHITHAAVPFYYRH
jgi:hypothetical protein